MAVSMLWPKDSLVTPSIWLTSAFGALTLRFYCSSMSQFTIKGCSLPCKIWYASSSFASVISCHMSQNFTSKSRQSSVCTLPLVGSTRSRHFLRAMLFISSPYLVVSLAQNWPKVREPCEIFCKKCSSPRFISSKHGSSNCSFSSSEIGFPWLSFARYFSHWTTNFGHSSRTPLKVGCTRFRITCIITGSPNIGMASAPFPSPLPPVLSLSCLCARGGGMGPKCQNWPFYCVSRVRFLWVPRFHCPCHSQKWMSEGVLLLCSPSLS